MHCLFLNCFLFLDCQERTWHEAYSHCHLSWQAAHSITESWNQILVLKLQEAQQRWERNSPLHHPWIQRSGYSLEEGAVSFFQNVSNSFRSFLYFHVNEALLLFFNISFQNDQTKKFSCPQPLKPLASSTSLKPFSILPERTISMSWED